MFDLDFCPAPWLSGKNKTRDLLPFLSFPSSLVSSTLRSSALSPTEGYTPHQMVLFPRGARFINTRTSLLSSPDGSLNLLPKQRQQASQVQARTMSPSPSPIQRTRRALCSRRRVGSPSCRRERDRVSEACCLDDFEGGLMCGAGVGVAEVEHKENKRVRAPSAAAGGGAERARVQVRSLLRFRGTS